MNCTNCGNPLKEGMKFCTACGTPVAVAPVAQAMQRVFCSGDAR